MTAPTAPTPGSPEHDAAMAAKFDNQSASSAQGGIPAPIDNQAAPERPAWLPEKFKSPEELAAAYAEAEKKISQGAAPAAPNQGTKIPEGQPAGDPLKGSALSLDDFAQEFTEKGALSQESYDKLAAAGHSKGVVDAYIAGQQALARELDTKVYGFAGGQEQFGAMIQWAADNLSADQKVSFNKAIDSRDLGVIELAVEGLKSRMAATGGLTPQLVQGGTSASAGGYQSRAQVTAAMRDLRYQKDPAYRAEVYAKLERTASEII